MVEERDVSDERESKCESAAVNSDIYVSPETRCAMVRLTTLCRGGEWVIFSVSSHVWVKYEHQYLGMVSSEKNRMTDNWIHMEKHGFKWKKVISFSGRCRITLHRTLLSFGESQGSYSLQILGSCFYA